MKALKDHGWRGFRLIVAGLLFAIALALVPGVLGYMGCFAFGFWADDLADWVNG